MMETLAKVHEGARKKKILPCTIKKRNLIIAAYRKNKGSIIDISRATGISIRRVYRIFEDFPELRQEIDTLDETMIETRKQKAVDMLDKNVKAGLQDAIKYTLDKEPRKHRGKIVVNKENQIGGGNVQVNLVFKEVDQRETEETTKVDA